MPVASPAPRRISAWIDGCSPQSARRLLFAMVVLFVWGMDTHGTYAGSGDEPHYAMIAHSLVFDRDLDLANNYADPTNLVGAGTLEPEAHAIHGPDGRLRPVHDVGLPLLSTPVFAITYRIAERSPAWIPPQLMRRARLNPPLVLRHLNSLCMTVVTGALAVVLFGILRPMAGSQARAFAWTLVFVLSPPLLSHSYLFFTEIPSALVALLCIRELTAQDWRMRHPLLLGLFAGTLLLLHIRNIGFVCGLGLWVLWRIRFGTDRLRMLLAFGCPIAITVAFRTALNLRFWGTPVTGPHVHYEPFAGVTATLTQVSVRVLGLLFDQEHGLLAYAPLYLLVLPGLLVLWKSNRHVCTLLLLLLVAYCVPILLPMTNPHGWSGGWTPAARFLVPVAPLCAIAAFGYRTSLDSLPRAVTVLLGLQWVLNALYWSKPKVLWNAGTGRSALAAFVSPAWLDLPSWLPSWHRPSGFTVMMSAILMIAWIGLSVRVVRRLTKENC